MACDWNVLVYMAGDNNLEGAAVDDINEMEAVGSTDRVRVAVQVDRAEGFDHSNGNWEGTRRYRISKGRSSSAIESELVEDLGELNSGDAATVTDFFLWGVREQPERQSMLVFWNHGSGFYTSPEYFPENRGFTTREVTRARRALRRSFFESTRTTVLSKPEAIRAILYDDASMDALDCRELGSVLASVHKELGRPVDVVGMDACLMSMVEVAWQAKDDVRVLVGSQELEPGDGWPYDAVLRRLDSADGVDPAGAGASIVQEYSDSYRPSDLITQSAINLTRLGDLGDALDRLAGSLISSRRTTRELRAFEVFRAHRRAISFFDGNYVDIASFAKALEGLSESKRVRTACRAVIDTVGAPEGPVIARAGKGGLMADACGLSIYLPPIQRLSSDHYGDLAFATDTRWGRMLDQVFG